jgi:hypothetical protein
MGFIEDSEKIAKIVCKLMNDAHSNGTPGNGTQENYSIGHYEVINREICE